MTQKLFKFCVAFMFVCGISFSFTQEVVTTTGGDLSGSGGTVSYSIGQIVYTTNSGSGISVAEGVQQPYEIQTVGTMESNIKIALNVFPNPTKDLLTLEMNGHSLKNVRYKLMDTQGRLIEENNVNQDNTQIVTRDLPPAIYFLHILKKNKPIQSFKIIKN
jgi:hypothetical protein